MFCEVVEQALHDRKISPVDQVAAAGFAADQPGMGQLLEMKRQCAGADLQRFSQRTGGQALRAGDDQRTKGAQAQFLRQRC